MTMSEPLCLTSKKSELPVICYGAARAYHPAYPILLALALVVSAASLAAWCYTEFSLDERAARGEARAQYLLGKRYFDAAVSPRDYERAATLVRKSANQGYARAQTG